MKYILFGASQYLHTHIDKNRIGNYEYIVDNDKSKIGTYYLGKEIKSPDVLLREDKNDIFIVITAYGKLYSIEYELKRKGFIEGVHFEWYERLCNHYPEHIKLIDKKSDNWKRDESNWRKSEPVGVAHERAILVSEMINWENVDSLLDLGAGSEPMRYLLPDHVKYYPVDYQPLTENTIVCDFNKKEFPDITADVVVMIGVHGYIDYQMWLIDQAVNAMNDNGQLIISFNYSTGNYNVIDFIIKYSDKVKCTDYAFRDDEYGIFVFRKAYSE